MGPLLGGRRGHCGLYASGRKRLMAFARAVSTLSPSEARTVCDARVHSDCNGWLLAPRCARPISSATVAAT